MPDHPGYVCRNKSFTLLDVTPKLLKRTPVRRIKRCSVDTSNPGIGLDCPAKAKTTTKFALEKMIKENRCDGPFKDVFVDLQ